MDKDEMNINTIFAWAFVSTDISLQNNTSYEGKKLSFLTFLQISYF